MFKFRGILRGVLKLDVTLLADVFENFRAINHKLYGLDVAKYLILPSFSFDAMLLQTKVKLELITDLEQYEFIQKTIRGGISGQYTRYAKANYPTLPDYNEAEPLSYLHMFDCNMPTVCQKNYLLVNLGSYKRMKFQTSTWKTRHQILT